MPSKEYDDITYPFPNFNSCTIETHHWNLMVQLECISSFTPHFIMDVLFIHVGIKVNPFQ